MLTCHAAMRCLLCTAVVVAAKQPAVHPAFTHLPHAVRAAPPHPAPDCPLCLLRRREFTKALSPVLDVNKGISNFTMGGTGRFRCL